MIPVCLVNGITVLVVAQLSKFVNTTKHFKKYIKSDTYHHNTFIFFELLL